MTQQFLKTLRLSALLLAAAAFLAVPSADTARAQTANAPPVVDMASAYWERDPDNGGWNFHVVIRAHDIDSTTLRARVLVLDRQGNRVLESLQGNEVEEPAEFMSHAVLFGAADLFGRIEIFVYDDDGNELPPVVITDLGQPNKVAPRIRSGKIDRSKSRITLRGKGLGRIVGVNINGTDVATSSLSVEGDQKTLRISGSDSDLGLTEGLNTVVVRTANGASNACVIRK